MIIVFMMIKYNKFNSKHLWYTKCENKWQILYKLNSDKVVWNTNIINYVYSRYIKFLHVA